MRVRLIEISLLLGSIAVALIVLEIGLRILGFGYPTFHRPDERLGLRLREGAEGWFRSEGEAYVKINTAGFRDRERILAKPPGVFRIAVLGDSYIEALQVDLAAAFHSQLEHRLNRCKAFEGKAVEVLSFGTSSYGTAQELIVFREIASKYSPDLVLLAFFAGNDVRNNSRELESDRMRPFFELRGDQLVVDHSFATSDEFKRRTNLLRAVLDRLRFLRIIQAGYLVKDRLQQQGQQRESGQAQAGQKSPPREAGLDDAVYVAPNTPEWQRAWQLTERLLAQLAEEVRAAGARLVLVSLSTGVQVHPKPDVREAFRRERDIPDLFYPDRRITGAASAIGVQSMMLAPTLQRIAERDKIFLHGFPNTRLGAGHWNEAGHRLGAELVAAQLCGSASPGQR